MYADQQTYWPSCRQAGASTTSLTFKCQAWQSCRKADSAHLEQVRVDVGGFQDPCAQLAGEHHVPIHGLSSDGRYLCSEQG